MMVSKGVYEYFLANACLNLSCNLFLAFNQIIYENAADLVHNQACRLSHDIHAVSHSFILN